MRKCDSKNRTFSKEAFYLIFFQAPALQVVEHARAVLEDDRKEGIQRSDPVLKRIAKTRDEHSVFWLHFHVLRVKNYHFWPVLRISLAIPRPELCSQLLRKQSCEHKCTFPKSTWAKPSSIQW